jgi:hypothetical protein
VSGALKFFLSYCFINRKETWTDLHAENQRTFTTITEKLHLSIFPSQCLLLLFLSFLVILWLTWTNVTDLLVTCLFVYLFIYLFIVLLGFEFKAWCLPGRCSTTWVIPPALF